MKLSRVLKKPVVTEKSLLKAGKENVFIFEVDKKANKRQIKQAVESQFEVSVERVRTATRPGKIKGRGMSRLHSVQMPSIKKAFVKLKEGETIDLFEIGG